MAPFGPNPCADMASLRDMSDVIEIEFGYGNRSAAGSKLTTSTGRSNAVKNWCEKLPSQQAGTQYTGDQSAYLVQSMAISRLAAAWRPNDELAERHG